MPRILLVETDRLLADTTTEYLRRQGYQVDWQADPQEALMLADKNKPDVVILDLVLATHNGVEFLYEFRSYPDWTALPVIAFCSLSPREIGPLAGALKSLGVAAYHYKPTTSLAELCRSVDQVLQPQPTHR